jgi:nucleotide-binding universal stress UspA family protein
MGGRRGVDEEIATGVAGAEARRMEEELGCRVSGIHTPYGSRAHGILATAGAVGAGLIVVGGRKLGIVEELFTYRVSEAVVQQSLRPVLLVREDGDAWPPRHIIVGCDGSPEAVRAAALSSWIARLADADLALVAVVDADAPASEEATRNARRALEVSAASVGAQGGEVRTTTRVVERTDVPAALREACSSTAGPRLLALGARGSSSLNRNPGFSVSRSVTHHTHLPLLLVPPLHAR